jgi:hypothetical protein
MFRHQGFNIKKTAIVFWPSAFQKLRLLLGYLFLVEAATVLAV